MIVRWFLHNAWFLAVASGPPAVLLYSELLSVADVTRSVAVGIAVAWFAGVVMCLRWGPASEDNGVAHALFIVTAAVPACAALWYLLAAPQDFDPLLNALGVLSLLPFGVETSWRARLSSVIATERPTLSATLIVVSVAGTVLVVELVGTALLEEEPTSVSTINSPDRTYWYYADPTRSDPVGIYPPFPNIDRGDRTILVLGDSIAAPGRPVNFVSMAAETIADDCRGGEFTVLNAGMPGFSLMQIERFYRDRLARVAPSPEIVVIGFLPRRHQSGAALPQGSISLFPAMAGIAAGHLLRLPDLPQHPRTRGALAGIFRAGANEKLRTSNARHLRRTLAARGGDQGAWRDANPVEPASAQMGRAIAGARTTPLHSVFCQRSRLGEAQSCALRRRPGGIRR